MKLQGVLFMGEEMEGVHLIGVKVVGVNMVGVMLVGVKSIGAKLVGICEVDRGEVGRCVAACCECGRSAVDRCHAGTKMACLHHLWRICEVLGGSGAGGLRGLVRIGEDQGGPGRIWESPPKSDFKSSAWSDSPPVVSHVC